MALTIGPEDVRQALGASEGGWQVKRLSAATQLQVLDPVHRLGYVPGPGAPTLEESESVAARQARSAAASADWVGAPTKVDWRARNGGNYVTGIRDQAGCGSCVAFGVVAAVESMVRIGGGNPNLKPNLSEGQLFFCYGPQTYAGTCPEGGWWPDPALDAMRSGLTDESRYPYSDADQPCAVPSDWRNKVTRITGWQVLSSPAAIKAHLASVGPVVACFTVYEDFYFYGSGVYKHVAGDLIGGHCICVVGYDDGQRCWIVKNSWGGSWGESGFVRFAYGSCGIDDMMWAIDQAVVTTLKPWPTVKRGAKGDSVRSLQHLLRARGQTPAVDGDFGAGTEKAVRAHQKVRNLTIDGVVGPQTWGVLVVTVRRGSRGEAVKAVQAQLKVRGVPIVVDGAFGAATQRAVKDFQTSVGAEPDGVVGAFSWQALVSGMK